MKRSLILAMLLGAGAVMAPHIAFAQTEATDTPAAVASPMATDTANATTDQSAGSTTTTTTTSTGGGYWGLLGLVGLLGLMGMRSRTTVD